MCGIAGMAGVANEPLLRQMLAITKHRGPNDSGTYVAEGHSPAASVAIGNNRLSIIDLSPAGHQPMCNEDGSVWVAYNGEIYNFPELREELVRDGHQFKSHTDTEVLVHLYEKYGPEMVNRLNGMFAFALWDTDRRELWIFRDRMGIKPLYYAQLGERLYFASEIKALLACPELTVDVDRGSLYQYLAYLYVPNPATIFKGVFKLQPGHRLCWRRGAIRIESYWDPVYSPYFRESEQEIAERLRELLIRVTRRQLISDVPVGFFLSGGVDSSTLVACAAETHDTALTCFSIAYKQQHGRLEQCSDDAHYARLVASHFGAVFNEVVVDPDVTGSLPKVVWHLDEPIADPAAIATFLICDAAAPSVTVLLSGQGADEVFAGYRVHRAHKMNALLRLIPRTVREELAPAWLKWLATHKDKVAGISPGLLLAFCRFSEKALRTAGLNPQEQYAVLRSYLLDDDLRLLLSRGSNAETAACSYRDTFLRHFGTISGAELLNQMLYVDAKTFLPDLNLAYSDKLSMACSIEVRVPFLDNEVVDFLQQVPPKMKIRGLTQKHILRKAMKGLLPKVILQRRKAAFGLPIRSWLKNELREMLTDMLSEDRVRRRDLFDPRAVSRMIRENETGERDYTLQLWGLLTMELWHQAFVDQRLTIAPERIVV
jgi:asparagine synthase (glutamine-hydrolysing)